MKFEDLSDFDLDLIKSMARQRFATTKCNDAQTALIQIIFECIYSKGFDIVKSDRASTWSKLEKWHYTEAAKNPNWWK